jgi:predicted transcriptional regulator
MLDIQRTDWLEIAMSEIGMQTGDLADRANVSRSQIQRIRNGMPPRLDTLRRISAALEAARKEKAKAA